MANKDSAVLKVAADIKEPQKAIAEINALVKKMGDNINVASSIGVKAFRSEAAAAEELLRKLGASDKQLGDLARTTQRVEQAAAAHLSRIGGAARTMASGFEAMARTGNIAGEATKQIVAQGAELAFTFGAAGPIVGAIGIASLALFSMFERTRKEMEETRKKAISELLAMGSATDVVKSAEALRSLTSGNLDARTLVAGGALSINDLSAEQLGIEGLRQRIAQRRAGLSDFVAQGTGPGGHTMDPNAPIRDAIRKDEEDLAKLVEQRTKVEVLYTAALARTNDMAKVGASIAKETASHKQAEKDAQERIADLLRNAKNDARDDKAFDTLRADQDERLRRLIPSGLGSGRPGFTPVSGADAAASAQAALADVVGPSFWERMAAGIHEADDAQLDFANNMASVTTASVDAFASASVNAFLLFAESGKLTGKGFGQAILTGVEQAAAGKALFYLAEAFGDLALAAIGFPGGAAGAAMNFKAAGMMAAIAGGAGALGGNAAGGNSPRGGGTRSASFNSGVASTFDTRTPAEVKIYGGLLDTSDTRQMDALADAMRALSGRDVIFVPA